MHVSSFDENPQAWNHKKFTKGVGLPLTVVAFNWLCEGNKNANKYMSPLGPMSTHEEPDCFIMIAGYSSNKLYKTLAVFSEEKLPQKTLNEYLEKYKIEHENEEE